MTQLGEGLSASGGPLTGQRIAITRSPDRAKALATALQEAGAEVVLVPLIDFELPASELPATELSTSELPASEKNAESPDVRQISTLSPPLQRLRSGDFEWLVISSITTVRALKQLCSSAAVSLTELVPAATKIATIGPTSAAAIRAEGLEVTLAPSDNQSADGLLELWPRGEGRVFLPQSNLAQPTLANGIAEAGWSVEVFTAYQTTSFPADPDRRLTAQLAAFTAEADSAELQLIDPSTAAQELTTGAITGVVLASGSAAQQFADSCGKPPETTQIIAIGQPTAKAANAAGLSIAATAARPTPAGIVEALINATRISTTGDIQ